MKSYVFAFAVSCLLAAPGVLRAVEGMDPRCCMGDGGMGGMSMDREGEDARKSLGLSPMMREYQKKNMRDHLRAVNGVVAGMAAGDFPKASAAARSGLGLTEEMKKMCDMMGDEGFRALALEFHKSGDALADALKSGNREKSLSALDDTLSRCVACHDAYRQ